MLVLLLMLAANAAGSAPLPAGRAAPDAAQQLAAPAPETLSQLDTIKAAIDAGRLQEARAMLTALHIASDRPESDDVTLLGAELLLQEGDAAGAEASLRGLPAIGRFRCPVLRIGGHAALAREATDQAIDLLGRLANECTPGWRDWTALARSLADADELDASRYAFARALDRTDRPAEVHADFGGALLHMGRIDDAEGEYALALAIDPQDETARDGLDMISGLRGIAPERAVTDSDTRWSQRLARSAEGARNAGRASLARSLYAQAAMVAPRYDERLIKEATKQ